MNPLSSISSASGAFINSGVGSRQDGKWKGAYGAGVGLRIIIYSIGIQSTGKILCAGAFDTYYKRLNTTPTTFVEYDVNSIVRLRVDGTIDSTFNNGCRLTVGESSGICYSVEVLEDDKFVCAGIFTEASGESVSNIARFYSNGAYDNSFSSGTGFNGRVNRVICQSDGKLICVGGFTEYNGNPCKYITRLNDNGSIDSGFFGNNEFETEIRNAYLLSDGKIMCIGGRHSVTKNTVVRVLSSGKLDTTFNHISTTNSFPTAFAIDNKGRYIIAETYIGTLLPSIHLYSKVRRLYNTGGYAGVDSPVFINIPRSGSGSAFIFSLCVTDSNDILCGGNYNRFNGRDEAGISLITENLVYKNIGFKLLDYELDKYYVLVQDIQIQNAQSRRTKKIIVSGAYRGAGKSNNDYVSRWGIMRLNDDFSVDKYDGEPI